MKNEITPMDSIEITIRYIRACYPVSEAGIASELLAQCSGIKTPEQARLEARRVIDRGMGAWLALYDGMEDAYAIRG